MDDIAEILGTIFELGDISQSGRDRPQTRIVYERYLCGGPKTLDINDR